MIVYKLFRLRKDGSIGPLFINARLRMKIGEWMPAEFHPTKGYAVRPWWHCCALPIAPHLTEKGRVWAACEVDEYMTYFRPQNQGLKWILAKKIKVLKILTPEEVEKIRESF